MKGMDCFAFAHTSPTFAAKLKPSPKPDAKKEKIFTMLDLHSNKNEASCWTTRSFMLCSILFAWTDGLD